MAAGKIHIGTSGFNYKHWRGSFYPDGLRPDEYLSYYAIFFGVTELNTSFYRLPRPETVLGWVDKVPAGFRFCPKISRYITHIKRLKDPESVLPRFFEVFDLVKDRLGPVLVQLPPNLGFDYATAERFFRELRTVYRGYEFVLEVRHAGWLGADALNLMTRFGIGWVISQSGEKFPYAEQLTAQTVYVRFHGPGRLYASPYSEAQLYAFARKFAAWMAEGHNVWVFFNNDVGGYAYMNALRLQEIMQEAGSWNNI